MITVRPSETRPGGVRPLTSGTTFGFFDQPLVFNIVAEPSHVLGKVLVTISQDPKRRSYEVELKGDQEGVRVNFFNPGEGGTSGLMAPIAVLWYGRSVEQNVERYALSLIFHVEVLRGATTFRLTYEFAESLFVEIAANAGESVEEKTP